MYHFKPTFKIIGGGLYFPEKIIQDEPMLFSASREFAMRNGGIITQNFVTNYLHDHEDWIIDTRVHMLMPGWYPCIPGWHHDDVPRPNNGQPDYEKMEYKAIHRMCVVGNTAMPQFLNIQSHMPKVEGDTIYKVWDEILEKRTKKEDKYTVRPGDVIDFTWQDFHRGMPAEKNGWRFFIRASRNTKRPFKNKVRTQVQVYMPVINAGW
jgi:hypothetical protein